MKSEYDFSKGQRGKFYHPNASFRFPIYLAPDVEEALTQIAAQQHREVQDVVNEWLRANLQGLHTQG